MSYQLNGIYEVIMMSGRIRKLCDLKIKGLCAMGRFLGQGMLKREWKNLKSIKNIAKGIYRGIVQVNFVMKVGAGGPARSADQSDFSTFLNMLPFFDQRLFQMCVFCFKASGVLHDDDPAITALPAVENHQSIGR